MTNNEQALLGNVLDSLDRLFDNESRVIDVYALLFATAQALATSEFGPRVEPFVSSLAVLMRKSCTEETRRDEALIITDDLRHFLSDVLPFL
jgi:hypothetical protein